MFRSMTKQVLKISMIWFIKACLCRTILGLINHGYLSFLFNSIESLFNQIYIQLFEYFFNIFSTNMHPISFNLIRIQIQYNLHAMSFNVFIRMEFQFNKITWLFSWINQLIITSNAKQCGPKVEQFFHRKFQKNKNKLLPLLESLWWMDFLELILQFLDLKRGDILSLSNFHPRKLISFLFLFRIELYHWGLVHTWNNYGVWS